MARQVIALLSPPHWPPYNGAIEAGFGSAKTRICIEAARHGRFDHWLFDDVEAARQLGNRASRPWGVTGPTPEDRFIARPPLTAQQRQAFGQAVRRQESIILHELELTPEQAQQLSLTDRAAVAREAISRALQQLGYLLVQRKRITTPFNLSFRAIIT